MALISNNHGAYRTNSPTMLTMGYGAPPRPYVVYSSPPYTPPKCEKPFARDYTDDSELTATAVAGQHDYSHAAAAAATADSCYDDRSSYGLLTPQR